MSLQYLLGGVLEEGQDFLGDSVERLLDGDGRGSDDVLDLGHSDLLELHSGHLLDSSDDVVLLSGDESDAGARLAGSTGSAGPVDVRVDVVRRRQLDDEVDEGDVESSGCHIGGNHALYLSLSEGLEDDLSLFLRDVSMEHIGVHLEVSVELDVVGLGLLIGEDDCLAVGSSVDTDDVSDGRDLLVLGLEDNLEVLDCARGSTLESCKHVDSLVVALHVLGGDSSDPLGDCGREEEDLDVPSGSLIGLEVCADLLVDQLDVLLEALIEHLVRLVQDEGLEVSQLELASLLEVLDTSWSADYDFDSVLERSDLLVDVALSVDALHSELVWSGSEPLELIGDLNGQFSGRDQD